MADNTDNPTILQMAVPWKMRSSWNFLKIPIPSPGSPLKGGVAPIGSTLSSGTLNLLRIA